MKLGNVEIRLEMETPVERLKNGFLLYNKETSMPTSLLFVFWIKDDTVCYKVYDAREGREGKPLAEGEGEEALTMLVDVVVAFLEGDIDDNEK